MIEVIRALLPAVELFLCGQECPHHFQSRRSGLGFLAYLPFWSGGEDEAVDAGEIGDGEGRRAGVLETRSGTAMEVPGVHGAGVAVRGEAP